jgi:type II secretory pathway pseudopilin PulG
MKRYLRSGFTLMEIVLAIGLTSVVMYLLMTAIELYMVRVDSSRSRVESAQLARTLLDKIAADLTATRLYTPPAPSMSAGSGGSPGGGPGAGTAGGIQQRGGSGQMSSNQSGGGGSGAGFGGGSNTSGGGSGGAGGGSGSSGGSTLPPTDVQGVYGTIEQLRIDRSASPNWQRSAREVTPEEPATMADLPVSVRYYLVDGTRLTSQQLALRGVSDEETSESASGLYREVYTTASLAGESDPLGTAVDRDGAKRELLAPEVVKLAVQYFDGTQLVDEWDALEEGGLPAGIEIRLTLYEPSLARSLEEDDDVRATGRPKYRESELVEYRRFVRMPSVAPAQEAESLLQVGGEQGGGPVAGGQGQQGQGGGERGEGGDEGEGDGEE